MKTADYLAAVKAKLNITSDYALAKALKISKQTAGKYANGSVIPGPVVAFRVAEILGEQPAAVVAVFEQERAERDEREDESAEWRAWRKKFGGAAASILLAAGMGGFPNDGGHLQTVKESTDIYIVSGGQRRRKATPWDQLLRLIHLLAVPRFTPLQLA